jgi:hypothetical protein
MARKSVKAQLKKRNRNRKTGVKRRYRGGEGEAPEVVAQVEALVQPAVSSLMESLTNSDYQLKSGETEDTIKKLLILKIEKKPENSEVKQPAQLNREALNREAGPQAGSLISNEVPE